jgi:hypothetical protein
MPLVNGKKACSKNGESKNISTEVKSDRPKNHAIARAFEACRKTEKKSKAQEKAKG